jgi:GT2 family glycosyltransferase
MRNKNVVVNIIIVDNASRDNSLELCKSRYPNLTYIYNTHNIGFAAGANVGAKFALERNPATVTFCNPDTILDKACIKTLTDTIQNGTADIISPIIYKYKSSSIWFDGGKISFYTGRATHKKQSTDYISGCIMTVSPDVFKKIGLFDEQFFLYYEDADFSLRAHKASFKLAIISTAHAWHKELSETENSQKTYFLVLSGLLFFNKHSHGLAKVWFNLRFTLRKFKNNNDFKKNKPLADQVHKAYMNYEKRK